MSSLSEREKGQRMLQRLQGGEDVSEVLNTVKDVFPDFWKMTEEHLYGDIWNRPGLSVRDRILITMAALIALKYSDGIKDQMRYALNNGIPRDEILDIIIHTTHYAGYAAGVNAIFAARDFFTSEGESRTKKPRRRGDAREK